MYPACVPCRLAFAKAASVCRHSLMSWSGIGKIVHVKVLCCFARLVMLAIVLASPSVGDGSICCPWLTWTAKSGRVSLASHSPAPNTDFKEEVSAALIVTKGDSAVRSFGLVIFSANSSWLTWIAKVLRSCTSSDPQNVPLFIAHFRKGKMVFSVAIDFSNSPPCPPNRTSSTCTPMTPANLALPLPRLESHNMYTHGSSLVSMTTSSLFHRTCCTTSVGCHSNHREVSPLQTTGPGHDQEGGDSLGTTSTTVVPASAPWSLKRLQSHLLVANQNDCLRLLATL